MPLAESSTMRSTRWWDVSLLAGLVTITRFIFRSHDLYDIDSVNFALGIRRFDPGVHQPHPPGYFLYILMGRLLNVLTHDANFALVLLSVLSSGATVVVLYCMALDWFDRRTARFAGALFLFSPLAWFHGTVALTYGLEGFFSAFLGYLCWRLYCGNHGFLLPASLMLGISAGVRPSSLLFLGPLYLYALRREVPKRILAGAAVLLLTLLAWFLPMVWASGGLHAYFGALFYLWRTVPAKTTVFNSSPMNSVARAFTIVFIYLLMFGAASILPLLALTRKGSGDRSKAIFTLIWAAPALCFFTFIFLKFVNSGYLLLLVAPGSLWLGKWASDWYGNSNWRPAFKFAAVATVAAINVAIFIWSPIYCSYRSIRSFEADLDATRTVLLHLAPAQETLIVGFDSHFLGYRHAGYYLPQYNTVEYPEVRLKTGARVFVMHNRQTQLLPALPIAGDARFVLFPLPTNSSSYQDYFRSIQKKLPAADLKTVHAGGHDFVMGPISDLQCLFPDLSQSGGCISRASLHNTACKQPCTPSTGKKP
jgi:hypothetical protein